MNNHEIYVVFSIFSMFLMLLTLCTMFSISLSIYIQIIYRYNPSKYEKYFYLVGFFYYALFTALPFAINIDSYNEPDIYTLRCWLDNSYISFLAYYSHLWVFYCICIGFIIKIYRALNTDIFRGLGHTLRKKFAWLPIFSWFFWLIPSISQFIYKQLYNEYNNEADLAHFFMIPTRFGECYNIR